MACCVHLSIAIYQKRLLHASIASSQHPGICLFCCVCKWAWWEQVTAIAYDNPIPGFQTNNTINLRLWAAKPGQEFDLEAFNTGDYVQVGHTLRQIP